jgi:predicted GNAT family acetyltransferase
VSTPEPVVEVVDNAAQRRFEVHVDGAMVGKADYLVSGGRVIFTHAEVDPEWQGKGIAQELARQSLDAIRASGQRVVAQCPFYVTYLRRHPEYADLA